MQLAWMPLVVVYGMQLSPVLAQETVFRETRGPRQIQREATLPPSAFNRAALAKLVEAQLAEAQRPDTMIVRLYTSADQPRFSSGRVFDLSYSQFVDAVQRASRAGLCPSADILISGKSANVRYCSADGTIDTHVIGPQDRLLIAGGLARIVFADYWSYDEKREVIEAFVLTDGPFNRESALTIYRHVKGLFPADGVRVHVAREPWFPMVSFFPVGYPFVNLIRPPSAEVSATWPRMYCDDTLRGAEICSVSPGK